MKERWIRLRVKLTLFVTVATLATFLLSGPLGVSSLWLWWLLFGAGLLAGSILPHRPALPPAHHSRLSAGEFRRAVNLGIFLDKGLRDRVAEAMRLWQDCETLATNSQRAGLGGYFTDRLTSVRGSVLTIYEMASHLDSYQRHPVSATELGSLAGQIQSLEEQITASDSTAARAELEHQLRTKQTVLSSQQSLQSAMAKANEQLDNSLGLLQALAAEMRMTRIAGDGYVGGIQEVSEQLNHEVEDLRQVQQALDGTESSPTELGQLPESPPRPKQLP